VTVLRKRGDITQTEMNNGLITNMLWCGLGGRFIILVLVI